MILKTKQVLFRTQVHSLDSSIYRRRSVIMAVGAYCFGLGAYCYGVGEDGAYSFSVRGIVFGQQSIV